MKKIEVLKRAIEKLEGDADYDFMNPAICNCGLVAQVCLNVDGAELYKLLNEDWDKSLICGGWGMMCQSTGLHESVVFAALLQSGFTTEEITNLELLRDREVIKKMGGIPLCCSSKADLVAYMKSWVELLTEQQPRQAQIQPAEKVRRVYVTVSPEVKKGELVNGLN